MVVNCLACAGPGAASGEGALGAAREEDCAGEAGGVGAARAARPPLLAPAGNAADRLFYSKNVVIVRNVAYRRA